MSRPPEKPRPPFLKVADIVLDDTNPSLPLQGEVRRLRFEVNGFPEPPARPLIVRREHLISGRDLGTYYSEDYYGLHLVRGGRGVFVSDGHPYGLTRGDVYITPPHTVHGLRDMHGLDTDACYFQSHLFSRGEWKVLQAGRGFQQLFLPLRRGAAPDATLPRKTRFRDQRLHLPPRRLREAETTLEKIREELLRDEPLGDFMAQRYFFCLLGLLSRWHEEQPQEKATAKTRADLYQALPLSEIIRYCDENWQDDLSVPKLAAKAHLSPDYFARLFQAATGVPPATYVRNLRLQHAQFLLREEEMPIREIAGQCGFGDHDVFTRAFRAAFQLTPRQYRARFRGRAL